MDITVASDAAQSSIGAVIRRPGQPDKAFARQIHASSSKHITEVEFLAACEALEMLTQDEAASGREATIFSDSSAAVSWINRQGSTRAPQSVIARVQQLWPVLASKSISVRAVQAQGHLNVTADALSRFERLHWRTPRGILSWIMDAWGPVQVDVTGHPTKDLLLPGFTEKSNSFSDQGLQSNWSGLRVFMAPPWAMLPRVLAKLARISEPLDGRDPRSPYLNNTHGRAGSYLGAAAESLLQRNHDHAEGPAHHHSWARHLGHPAP
ncbi:RNase H domain [Carpediemonas membranifera]|uniref:RNase H domain n=1 Tax=Carpediemonas membranifera TaxID=201153 RepID=A0A8J6EB09_9EUKA|nr:RNase H domain [Carpediemonas membranifera]|eukprot:KAG9395905.1 RNase H domain [Carpediemonas membranifera]